MMRRFGHAGPFDVPAEASCAALAQLGYNEADVGQIVWVENLRAPFICAGDITQPAVPGQIVHSTDGSRLWRRLPGSTIASGYWTQRNDWHINAVNGTFEGDGSAASPISSWTELLSRLQNQQLLPSTVINLHSNLTEPVDLSLLVPNYATSLLVTGDPGAVAAIAGTVQTYTALNTVAPGESPLITSLAIADWTPYVGKRLRFTAGTAVGAMTIVSAANPGGLGLNVARIPRPAIPGYSSATLVTPAVGDAFVVEDLVTVPALVPSGTTGKLATILRGLALPDAVGQATQAIGGGRMIWQGCTVGDANFSAEYLKIQCSRVGVLGKPVGESCFFSSGMFDFANCVLAKVFNDRFGILRINNCVCMDTQTLIGSSHAVLNTGIFGGSASGMVLSSPGSHVQVDGPIVGYGNTGYGIDVAKMSGVKYSVKPVLSGTLNSFRLDGVAHPWVDAPLVVAASLAGITN